MDVGPVGRALSRTISAEEMASINQTETGLDSLIDRRSKQLEAENQEYREAAAWAESTRKASAAREAELREQWCEYHQEQGRRHRAVLEALVAHHEERAEALAGGDAA